VLAQIVADDPISLASMTHGVPDGLSEVVLKCLRRNRDERYSNVGEVARALMPYGTREGQLSVERIERVVAHHQRISTPVDLRIDTPVKAVTPVKGITPVHGGGGPAPPGQPLSPLAATAPDVEEVSSRRSNPGRSTPGGSTQDDATFGKYKLLAVLGQGGMADVFLAVLAGPEGLGFSKLVVIKRLRSGLASDPEFVSMLVDEARIAAKLNHPNVIHTHEVGVIQNEYYIAMEYLDGQPLNRIVQRARPGGPVDVNALPLAFRLGIMRDMLAGLHYAHELVDFDGTQLHLVHRDVSPQNVFVTYEGQVKVVDFGIAKARGRATETAQGVVKGKVAYMAPEQAGGQEIDRRADVFGAGVILWELLTGERMWKGVDDVAIIQKLLLDKVQTSPRAVNADVPKGLDAIVKKALARKKTDRYESAQAFQLAIEQYMEAEGLRCTPRELGEWVGQLFADRRKQTRSLIEAQLSELRAPTASKLRMVELRESGNSGGSSLTPPSAPTGLRLERLDQEPVGDDYVSRPDAALARSHPGQNAASTTWSGRTRARWAIVGAGALVTAGIAGVAFVRPPAQKKAEGITQSASTVTPEATPLPSVVVLPTPSVAAAPGEVHLVLASLTPGTEFSIDDEPKAKGPVALTRTKDDKPHHITASAPGYKPETKTFTFDKDVTWNAQLAPAPGGTTPPPRPHPSATPVASSPPPTTSASSGRKKRELDNDDPYKQPAPQ
jgi:serine/threonine-protein kinase